MIIYVDVIGLHRYVVVGSLAWLYGNTVYPLHCYRPLPLLPISSNTPLYLLTALVSHYSCLLHAFVSVGCSLPSVWLLLSTHHGANSLWSGKGYPTLIFKCKWSLSPCRQELLFNHFLGPSPFPPLPHG